MSLRRIVGCALLAATAALAACTAEVDRRRYAAGDPAVAVFGNDSTLTAWLGGCSVFGFQKLGPLGWEDRGTPIVCVWEGFAQPVEPGVSREDDFFAPSEPGIWRLHYPTGFSCAAGRPLSEASCGGIAEITTRPFEVVALCDPAACGPPLGMPNWLCPDGSVGGPTDRCLHDPGSGRCSWEIGSCPD